jgi:hypothetical protein
MLATNGASMSDFEGVGAGYAAMMLVLVLVTIAVYGVLAIAA